MNFRSYAKVSSRAHGCEGSHISSCQKPFAGMFGFSLYIVCGAGFWSLQEAHSPMNKAVNVGVDEFKDCGVSLVGGFIVWNNQTHTASAYRERKNNRQKSSFTNNTSLITTLSNINLVINEKTQTIQTYNTEEGERQCKGI